MKEVVMRTHQHPNEFLQHVVKDKEINTVRKL